MQLGEDQRVGIFIDGANLHASVRAVGFDIDFKRLLRLFREKSRLVRATYFAAIEDEGDHQRVRPLVDWLAYNGFAIVTKRLRIYTDDAGGRRVRGDIGVELTVVAMGLARHLDHIVIFSGDGDLRYLAAALQQMGKCVSVVSTLGTHPVMVADELRRQADHFVDLAELKPLIERKPDVAAR